MPAPVRRGALAPYSKTPFPRIPVAVRARYDLRGGVLDLAAAAEIPPQYLLYGVGALALYGVGRAFWNWLPSMSTGRDGLGPHRRRQPPQRQFPPPPQRRVIVITLPQQQAIGAKRLPADEIAWDEGLL